jgi:hypothetical protein
MPVNADRIFRVNITRNTRTLSRRSWGTVMFVAHHTVFPERSRLYTDPSEMLSDGFDELHPAYLAAVALCSQSPRPRTFKVGRRAGAPDQSIRLTPATPVANEVYGVTIGGVRFEVTADSSPSVAEICAALAALIAVDPDAIIASGVTSTAGIQNISGAALNGVIGDDAFAPARNLTITLGAHADWDATTIVVTGEDKTGRVITENFAVPNGGGVVLVGLKSFAKVTNVLIPAQTGTNGTLTMGVGEAFGDNPNLDITATDGTTHVDISADDAGAWFAYDDRTSNLRIEDRTAVPGTSLTADLDAIESADADWYGFDVVDAQSDLQVLQAAAWAETKVKLYQPLAFDSDVEDATDTDILSQLLDANYFRTLPFYTRDHASSFPNMALAGVIFAQEPGRPTFAFKTLAGVAADELGEQAVTRIIGTPESPITGKRGMVHVEIRPTGTNQGTDATLGGLTSGGEWADVIVGLDWAKATMQERLIAINLNTPKNPYTNKGASRLEGAVRSVLNLGATDRYMLFNADEPFVVNSTPVEDVSAEDKQARFYDGITFDAQLQGAIHSGSFGGTVRP